jgi:hypothetical protein
MANIPGASNVLPGVFTDVVTQTRGVAIPGGARLAAIIGEGVTDETIVAQALGGGQDGLNPSYTSTSGADGRHFRLTSFPIISNRTTLFKNGVPLVGTESVIDNNPFSSKYDYRIDIISGKIELQRAHLVDQGGAFYVPLSTNTGDGYLSGLTLVDPNAPPETWTVRCVGVQRDAMNDPIAGTSKFLAFGSVSGALLDANGNPIFWMANGSTVTNGVLTFAIYTTSAFVEGDAFTIKVASGVLNQNDSLTATYIPVANLNDPVLLQGMIDVVKRYGVPSVDNNLSLGAQLAFANNAPALITVQAAPAMPRRTSYLLSAAVDNTSFDDDDYIFPLPPGVVPDFNSNIHFFVTNNSTNVETQILPNKLEYYTLDTAGFPTTHAFIVDNNPAPGGYSYFYTVKESLETISSGTDGYIGRNLAFSNQGVFSSSTVYDSTYVGKALKVIDSNNSANIGVFHVTAVSGGKLYVVADGTTFSPSSLTANPSYLSDFINESLVSIQLIDPVTGLQVDGYAAVDGVVTTSGASTGQASLTSVNMLALAGGNYNNITGLNGYKIKINSTAAASVSQPIGNKGLYDIVSHTNNTIVIKKALVNESNMRFEVLDPNESSNYIVINRNVVPNGNALRVTIVDSKDASFFDAGWINVLESLEVVECDIVVPLPKQTISVIFQNALAHCKAMSNIRNKKERVLFIGAIAGLTPDNLTGAKPAAVEDIGVLEGIQGETVTDVLAGNVEDLANYSVPDAFGNTYRCVYFYPDQIVVQAGSDNVLIDGFYLAAAAAGYESADVRVENPITNKTFTGFTILRNKQFSQTVLEQLAAAGVTTLQPVAGGGRVVWGITTSQSGFPEEQEVSIIFIRDRVAKTLRAAFRGFIGNPEKVDTGTVLNTQAVITLNSLVSQSLITKFKDLVVQRDEVDPRQWNISVKVQPTYPVNFIYIKVSLGQI